LRVELLEDRRLLAATISGTVFQDLDADGLRDANETGQAGVVVFVDGNQDGVRNGGEAFATTIVDNPVTTTVDEAGRYELIGLADGIQNIAIEVTGNYRQSSPLAVSTSNGALTLLETSARPVAAVGTYPYEIVVAPDGNHAVVTWILGGAISVFNRNPQDGRLTFASSTSSATLSGGQHSVFGPSGRFLYVPSSNAQAINVLELGTNSSLTIVQAVTSTTLGTDQLNSVQEVTISPDGKHLYAPSKHENKLSVFTIDQNSGQLTLTQTLANVSGEVALLSPLQVQISADDKVAVVVTNSYLTTYNRDVDTGF